MLIHQDVEAAVATLRDSLGILSDDGAALFRAALRVWMRTAECCREEGRKAYAHFRSLGYSPREAAALRGRRV